MLNSVQPAVKVLLNMNLRKCYIVDAARHSNYVLKQIYRVLHESHNGDVGQIWLTLCQLNHLL